MHQACSTHWLRQTVFLDSSVVSALSHASSIGWVSGSDCFAPESMLEKYSGVPDLMYEQACAMSLVVGDQVLTADGTLAKLTRKIAHDDQHVLEVCVDDSRLRVTPSHRRTVPRTCTPVMAPVRCCTLT